MVYDHMVKVNGKYYNAGEDVPEINEGMGESPFPLSDEDITFETRPEKQYTKTDINKMNKAELAEMAKENGAEGADDMTGAELKEYLISVFGL